MLHKTNFVTLYLCTLEEVDHSQTKGWKSGIKSVQRQTHCDIGFLRVFLQTVGTTSWNLDWLPEKQGRVPACQPCFSLALGGAGQRHCRHPAQSPVLGPPATPALTAKKKEKVLSLFAHAVICSVLWCSRTPQVFAVLTVILLTAWNGEWCIVAMASASSSCRYWELLYFIGSAIFSLHPSIVCCLMPCTIYMVQLEIRFPFHVALSSHLLWDCQGSEEVILCHGLSVPKTYISLCLPHS